MTKVPASGATKFRVSGVTTVRVSGVTDWDALGARWRDLEQRSNGSFFQGWTWTGCLASERFTRPVLIEAFEDGRTVALALFNRRPGWPAVLYLGESGDPALDCPYIEHNGILAEAGREDVLAACLGAVARSQVVVMSGIGDVMLRASRAAFGGVRIGKTRESPFADLAALHATGGDYLSGRSANSRQQIRRSDRYYAERGALTVRQSESVSEAHRMLDAMAALHQAAWIARGQPGSFAEPFFGRFHRALIERGVPRGEVVLTEVTAGGEVIGILYNFRDRTGLRAYQSGFCYGEADARAKPGLTCHHAAIHRALADGAGIYDFLAGDDRYKRSLASGSVRQYWIEAGPSWAPRLLFGQLRDTLGQRSARRLQKDDADAG